MGVTKGWIYGRKEYTVLALIWLFMKKTQKGLAFLGECMYIKELVFCKIQLLGHEVLGDVLHNETKAGQVFYL